MSYEIDAKDWNESIRIARKALQEIETDPYGHSYNYIEHFIEKVEALVTMHQKQIPALFKPIIKERND